jgi:multiple sugar transport system ATP-binding protein
MSSVLCRDIYKRFGSVEVIHGINVDIQDGEFVVLVGPSGCGKSTLLRMVAGLEKITDGEILIGDQVVNMIPPKERDIAMVFQNYALYPHMTVFDNMSFSLKLAKEDKSIIKERVEKAANILNITDYLERYPRQLSGGQRQRVAMGRAIVRDPKVFLFDEPLSNLDAKLRVQMRTEIKGLHQRLKTTSIYVTHDQIEAMTMADKIVVMREGNVEQIGHPLDVYDKPNNVFVAGFIGSPSMNFMPAKINLKSGEMFVETENGNQIKIQPSEKFNEGQKIICGIRPEHFEVSTENMGIKIKVKVVEPTGADTLLFSDSNNIEFCSIFQERVKFKPGESLFLTTNPENVHIFDFDSNKRI